MNEKIDQIYYYDREILFCEFIKLKNSWKNKKMSIIHKKLKKKVK